MNIISFVFDKCSDCILVPMIRDFVNRLIFGFDDSRIQLERNLKSAIAKTEMITARMGESLFGILKNLECAEDGNIVQLGFDKLNEVMRVFKRISPRDDNFKRVRSAIESVGVSDMFFEELKKGFSLENVIENYKVKVLQNLAVQEMVREREDAQIKKQDENLFKRFLPSGKSGKRKISGLVENHDGKSKKQRKLRRSNSRIEKGYSGQELMIMRRKGICFYFPRGTCKRGKLCKFKHIQC